MPTHSTPDFWDRETLFPSADPPFVKPFQVLGVDGHGLAFADGHLEVEHPTHTLFLFDSLVALLERWADVIGIQWL